MIRSAGAGQIRVTIRVLAPIGPGKSSADGERTFAFPEGSTVESALVELGVAETQPVIAMRNGCYARPDEPLASGDALVILPPLDGG